MMNKLDSLSNEEKLDLFFNHIQELETNEQRALYIEGLKTVIHIFKPEETKLYIGRFESDGLLNMLDETSFEITPKGRKFQGYEQKEAIKKTSKSVNHIMILTIIGLIIASIQTCYTILQYQQSTDNDNPLQIKVIVPVTIDTGVIKKKLAKDTTVVVEPNHKLDSTNKSR